MNDRLNTTSAAAVVVAMSDAVEARAATLLRDATVRWLVKEELAFLLMHRARLGVPILRQLQLRPTSGRLLLYDTRDVPDFKKDGWRWQKRKDQSGRVREDRAKLVINREVIVLGTYVHSSDVATFHRRSYALRDADPHIVLVHYFDEVHKAAHYSSNASAATAMSTSVVAPSLMTSAAQKPSAKGLKRALPVSIRPVATVSAMTMSATSAPHFPLTTAQKKQTMTVPTESAAEETVDAIMSNCFELDFLQSSASRLDAQQFHHTDDSSSSSIARDGDFDLLRGSGMLMDGLSDFSEDLLYPVEATAASTQTAVLKLEPAPPSAAATVVTPAQISDFSPDWDFTDGGAKVLICLASPLPLCSQESQTHMFVQFGILNRVPAEQLSDTVVRCTAPPSNATGSKEIYVCCSRDQLHPECTQLSNKRLFTYKSQHPQPSPALSAAPSSAAVEQLHELHLEPSTTSGMEAMASGKRGRSPRRLDERAEMRDALRFQRSDRLSESSNLSSFVDTDLDERQCKIRVVERLSEFHHAIWTTASPGELLGVPESSSFLLQSTAAAAVTSGTGSMEPLTSQSIAPSPHATATDASSLESSTRAPTGASELLPTDSSSVSLLGLDDSTIETLSDQDLEQLSEKLLERVVQQLVTVAHTSEELLDELNSLDEAGLSLLHYVSFYNYSQLVPLLLSHGAHVNQQSTQGQTALHLAAGCGHHNVVDVLVQSGADVFALDFDGFTAADRADKSGHLDVAASLQQLMGSSSSAMRTPDDAMESSQTPEQALQHSVAGPSLDAFAMDIDFGDDADAVETTMASDIMGSPSRMGESAGDATGASASSAKSKNYVGENHEHNRKLLLGAFSTMSLHDKCALSLSISRDPSSMSSRRRGSSISDDMVALGSVSSTTSSGGGTGNGAGPSAAGTPLRSLTSSPARYDASDATTESLSRENDSLYDSDVKSVIADDEESLTKLEAAMELMGPEERQSLEDEVKLLQHNIRAWLLKRNCKHMRETTKRLHEATQNIVDQQQQQLDHVVVAAAASSATIQQQEQQTAALSERERAAVTVQAATRSMLARKSFLQTKNVTIKVQAATRGVLCRKHFARMKTHALASLVIQRNVREWWYKQQPSASRISAASKSDSSSSSSPHVRRTGELCVVDERQDEDEELAQHQFVASE